MRIKFLSSLAVLALTVAGMAADSATKEQTAPRKMPALLTDGTPVGEGSLSGRVTSYADVIEPVQKAVVSVYSTKIVRQRMNPFYRQLFGDQTPPDRESKEKGLGSGVIISPDGYILTNNHVVEGADELNVLLTDERELKAKVIGADPKTDIAVIKIEAENLPVAVMADSDKLRVGDVVFAIGNPLEVGQTVTMGIVSAKNRRNVHILTKSKATRTSFRPTPPSTWATRAARSSMPRGGWWASTAPSFPRPAATSVSGSPSQSTWRHPSCAA